MGQRASFAKLGAVEGEDSAAVDGAQGGGRHFSERDPPQEVRALHPRVGVLGHPLPMFAAGAARARASLPRRVLVGFGEFLIETVDVVGFGLVENGLGEDVLGKEDGEASQGFRLRGHADPSVDNPQGGADVVVTH